jgi:hypothetical protein
MEIEAMRRPKLTQPKGRAFDQLSEAELLKKKYTCDDPESLENLSNDPPPDEKPEVEYIYDMTQRGIKVACVFCGYPNHYIGAVVKYAPSGGRRTVGHTCAYEHYGVQIDTQIVEFNAGAERQSYIRRRHHAFACIPKVTEELLRLRQHSAVQIHDSLLRTWRYHFAELGSAVGEVVKRGEQLVVDRVVYDEAAERARKEKLGDRFESERLKGKAVGKSWRITKSVRTVIGPVAGPLFFLPGTTITRRLDEIQAKARTQFHVLRRDDLNTPAIRTALHELGLLVEEIRHEFRRLDALQQAFHPENLKRIAAWANTLHDEEGRRTALFDNRRYSPGFVRYVAFERSISDNQSKVAKVSLPAYRVPKPTLVDCLVEATSLNAEPPRHANSNEPPK